MSCIKRESIKGEIERLEKALKECADSRIRKMIIGLPMRNGD
jgi:hypothetical protein